MVWCSTVGLVCSRPHLSIPPDASHLCLIVSTHNFCLYKLIPSCSVCLLCVLLSFLDRWTLRWTDTFLPAYRDVHTEINPWNTFPPCLRAAAWKAATNSLWSVIIALIFNIKPAQRSGSIRIVFSLSVNYSYVRYFYLGFNYPHIAYNPAHYQIVSKYNIYYPDQVLWQYTIWVAVFCERLLVRTRFFGMQGYCRCIRFITGINGIASLLLLDWSWCASKAVKVSEW